MFRVSLACETWCGLWFVSSLKPIWSSNLSVKEKLIVLIVFSSPLSMWSFPRWLNFWCNVDWAHRRWMWQMLQGGVAFYRESTFWITLPGCSYWCHVYLNGWMYMYVCLSVSVCVWKWLDVITFIFLEGYDLNYYTCILVQNSHRKYIQK